MSIKSIIGQILKEEFNENILVNVVERPPVNFHQIIRDEIQKDQRVRWPSGDTMIIIEPMDLTPETFKRPPADDGFSVSINMYSTEGEYEAECAYVASKYPNDRALEKHRAAKKAMEATGKIEGFKMLIGSRLVWVSALDKHSIKEAMMEKDIKEQEDGIRTL